VISGTVTKGTPENYTVKVTVTDKAKPKDTAKASLTLTLKAA
jgi:chitodextrinase